MWVLKKYPFPAEFQDGVQFYFLDGRKYDIGRKDCDVVLSGDASISRKHATIRVTNEEGKSKPYITDTSKLGVEVNGGRLIPQEETLLNDADILSFGRMQLKFKLEYYDVHVVMSGITNSQEKNRMKHLVQKLGGKTSSDWVDSTTHLVMEKLIFTIKVVCAIASCKAIVTPKFIEDLVDCCDKKKGQLFPSPNDYLPPVAEQSLVNQERRFALDERRRSLFVGKVFITLVPKQFSRMKQAVELAGGCLVLKPNPDSKIVHDISSSQVIVLKVEGKDEVVLNEKQKSWMKDVYAKVNSNNLRLIRESEIGLAILHVSLESFCNPATKSAPSLVGTTHTQALVESLSYTQQVNTQSHQELLKANPYQEEESEVSWNPPENKRKRLEEKETTEMSFKKPKLQTDDESDGERAATKNVHRFFQDIQNSGKDFQAGKIGREKSVKPRVADQNALLLEEDSEMYERGFNEKVPSPCAFQTPSTKKPIPDTYPSTSSKIQDGDIDKDVFSFSIDKSPDKIHLSDVVKRILSDTTNKSTSDVNEEQPEGNSRFKKAVSSTQESSDESIFMSETSDKQSQINEPSQNELIHENVNLRDGQSKLSTDQRKANAKEEGKEEAHVQQRVDLIREEDNGFFSNDDDDFDEAALNMTSEVYPLINKPKGFLTLNGFISTLHKKSTVMVPKEDPDLMDVDRDLVKTEFVSLVVKRTGTKDNTIKSCGMPSRGIKNFKSFKKQLYVGKDKLAKWIFRKSDLVPFESENGERENLFAELRERDDEEDEEAKRFDQLFEFDDREIRRRRR